MKGIEWEPEDGLKMHKVQLEMDHQVTNGSEDWWRGRLNESSKQEHQV
jgi:hypothetical protein